LISSLIISLNYNLLITGCSNKKKGVNFFIMPFVIFMRFLVRSPSDKYYWNFSDNYDKEYQNYYFKENGVHYAFQEERSSIFSMKRCNDQEGNLHHFIPFVFSKDTRWGRLEYMIHGMDFTAAGDQTYK